MGLLQSWFSDESEDCDEFEVIPSLPEELKVIDEKNAVTYD